MMCWMLGVSSAQMTALRANPSLAGDLAGLAQDEQLQARRAAAINRMPPEKREAAEARYRALMERMPEAREAETRKAAARARLEPIGPFEQALDLEKSWHIFHYLFTGHVDDAKAPGDALLTGEELGDDVGYGPARLHDEKETQDFARFLNVLDVARLQERLNYREMSRVGVYSMPMGPGSDAEFEAELRAEVGAYFPRLRDYVVRMAEKQDGLLIWLS
ncbi:MAG: DUF1877 family protein [Xanthobacteraceae bacterium]